MDWNTIKQAIAFIQTEVSRGTGYLITSDIVVTCAHVVSHKNVGDVVQIRINNYNEDATVAAVDQDEDCAILRLSQVLEATPLSLSSDICKRGDLWEGYGYPIITNNAGHPLKGDIQDIKGEDNTGRPSIILYSREVAADALAQGFSGSPVLVNGQVIGHLKRIIDNPNDIGSPRGLMGTLYACPVEVVMRLLPPDILLPKPTDSFVRELDDEIASHREDTQEAENDYFSQSIRDWMSQLNRQVEKLTQDQLRVILMLRWMRRVRISGCAGSGKTLVAAEKAIRLSCGGLKTLFLCHNPLLADHVRRLTGGSGVFVAAFSEWIAEWADDTGGQARRPWTNFEEPDYQTLGTAFDVITEAHPDYDAIIIDEGQDFRDEWWIVVEAALASAVKGQLYIFHDDNQTLLSHRASYPIQEPVIDLSRNCRNAGRIYELMKFFHPASPNTEVELKDQGKIKVTPFTLGAENQAIIDSIQWAKKMVRPLEIVVLWAGAQPVETSTICGMKIVIPTDYSWQSEVSSKFEFAIARYNPQGITLPPGGVKWIREQLDKLSNESQPTLPDIELVNNLARKFMVDHDTRRRITTSPLFRDGFVWQVINDKLHLLRPGSARLWPSEVILHFEREDWAKGIPAPQMFELWPYNVVGQGDYLRLYNVADYKGLEADAIMLIISGHLPMFNHHLYVGISRARFLLSVLVERSLLLALPSGWMKMAETLT